MQPGKVRTFTQFGVVLVLVGLLTYVIHVLLGRPPSGFDDADIFLAYARHLAAGEGFIYSRGGEPVEGFTSLLWVLVATVATLLRHPDGILLAVNVLLTALALQTLLSWLESAPLPELASAQKPEDPTRERPFFSLVQLLVLAWCLTSPAFLCHMTVGRMDTALWAFVLALCVTWALRGVHDKSGARWFAAALAAFVFTRPESLAWGPFLLAIAWLRLPAPRARSHARLLVGPALAWASAVAALTVFRLLYFGQPLPNAFYAKVSSDVPGRIVQGARQYLWEFVSTRGFVLVAVIAAIILLAYRPGPSRRPRPAMEALPDARAISLVILFGLALPVLVGGDHFGGHRFYQPLWPFLVLPLVQYASVAGVRVQTPMRSWKRTLHRVFVAAAAGVLFVSADPTSWSAVGRSTELGREFRLSQEGRKIGSRLERWFSAASPPSVGVYAAGGIAVTYDGPIFDLLGLNHRQMARAPHARGDPGHAGFNRAVFYELLPEIVFPRLHEPERPAPLRDPFEEGLVQGVFGDAEFLARYTRVSLRPAAAGADETFVHAWYRQDFLAWLGANDFTIQR